VITPRGFTSLPIQEAEYCFPGFIPTNKQTNKLETNQQWENGTGKGNENRKDAVMNFSRGASWEGLGSIERP